MTNYTIKNNEEKHGIEIYFDTVPAGETRNILKADGWRWHSVKKCWYRKAGAEAEKTLEKIGAENPAKADAKTAEEKPAKAAEKVNKYGVKVGDIFVHSWGYEQTNINYYEVTALKGSTMAEFREIGKNHYGAGDAGPMSEYVIPAPGAYVVGEEPFTKKIKQFGDGQTYCNSDYGFMYLTDAETPDLQTSYY